MYLLFKSLSFFSHSCMPNCHQSFFRSDSSIVVVKAVRDIDPGERLTVSWVDMLAPYGVRQARLKERGMQCECNRC